MTDAPTPHDITSAEVVAEWRAAMEGVTPGPWKRGRLPSYRADDSVPIRFLYRPDDSVETRIMVTGGTGENGREFDCDADAAWIARCSPSGISDLLATIERVEREREAVYAAMGNSVRFMDPPDGGDPTQAEMVANMRRQLAAAEARVTAFEAEMAGLVKALGKIQEPTNPERLTGSHLTARGRANLAFAMIDNFQSIAKQALSRSSTEVKNDGR